MEQRLKILNGNPKTGPTLYVMRRDQRIYENYAIEYGYSLSYEKKSEFIIGIDFSTIIVNEFQKMIMFEGLEELSKDCLKFNLPLFSFDNLKFLIDKMKIKNIILDYSPLRGSLKYDEDVTKICKDLGIYCVQVDAHNVVPHNLLETYKRTGKSVKNDLFKHFFDFLKEFKSLEKHKFNKSKGDFKLPSFTKHDYFIGGYKAGMNQVQYFFKNKFKRYADKRNSPDDNVLSDLSPYLHFGQISSQKVLLDAYDLFYNKDDKNLESFVNEIFVWKETSEHFCFHEKNYDNLEGALPWAKESLLKHADDKREKIYTKDILEEGKTKSELWNAAQTELREFNKIHGYVRMFWAKQMLKWTKSPEEALSLAICLNDKYSLDGNDPNGYTGIMWSICGTMDQGWKERDVIGKIRAMNEIKTKKYTKMWTNKKEKEAYLKQRKVK
ncbi:deoxyribodipyrimidine photo-lyase [Nosema bombycis CQ1]|uniref:Deoxyribodipyrimidine photo-lyase n=1 Tax=Nosema bombycis (strain CQ1 / CVCC 102059) TaxID=578461 RepID=R0MC38_NOSB1|nr:deoxyribodipyrimidine photo-lyase [Nosema bombycis CQ1]|eukprot:EOB15534.1 deoxyribodipyrimidine photo-lyase [Nosema bombycis CQ1]